MLEIERLAVSYGEVAALRDVSLTINKAEIVTLIGGNGAGKTTTLKTISGLLAPSAGDIRFEGPIDRRSLARPDRRARHRPGARGSSRLSAAFGREQSHRRRLSRPRSGGRPRHARPSVRDVSAAEGASTSDGRDAVGRRAADARPRPRDHVAPAAHAAGRAVAGARAARRRGGGEGDHLPFGVRA